MSYDKKTVGDVPPYVRGVDRSDKKEISHTGSDVDSENTQVRFILKTPISG